MLLCPCKLSCHAPVRRLCVRALGGECSAPLRPRARAPMPRIWNALRPGACALESLMPCARALVCWGKVPLTHKEQPWPFSKSHRQHLRSWLQGFRGSGLESTEVKIWHRAKSQSQDLALGLEDSRASRLQVLEVPKSRFGTGIQGFKALSNGF